MKTSSRRSGQKQVKPRRQQETDDFKSVAKRLECDPSEERFDRNLREIAKHGPEHAARPAKASRSR